MAFNKTARRARIKTSIRIKVRGTSERPRLTVFRSNSEIYAQVIDDEQGRTLVSAGSLKDKAAHTAAGIEQAKLVGKSIGEKAKAAGIGQVVFDRNGYLYHGRVKALADAAREAGLNF
ncbi:MAG: 50S ribosomal protein L18 [Bacteroidetes bacterium]|nr:50S ribosomal protein L18 [Bacteroidota bacterium]